MRVIRGFGGFPQDMRGAVIAIGNFDGVHRGHQALLLTTRDEARQRGRSAGVMVFEPHPREFFQPGKPHFRLTTLAEKLVLFERMGLDFAVVLDFDAALAALTPERFISSVLVDSLGVGEVVIGYDFFFGKDRVGTPEMLQAAGRNSGFAVKVVSPVAEDGEVFSSSGIRAKLSAGDVAGAAHALGHWWRVRGVVTGGAKRGTGLGFPTANIDLPKGTALGHGIYAVHVIVGAARYDGAAYLGTRPTFDDGAPVLEVFLLDFDGDLYGREIVVEFIDFVRGDRRFSDIEALKAQMAADCELAHRLLRKAEAEQPLVSYPLGHSTI